jgi:SLT domain-containing protein
MAQIGDLVPKSGIYTNPGVVVEKKDDGSVVVDTDPMSINKYHRYANTTGLSQQEKVKFNDILDQIYTKTNDVEKINDIQNQIDDLKQDPSNHKVVQYLRNQQSHLIRQAKELPAAYQTHEGNLKT